MLKIDTESLCKTLKTINQYGALEGGGVTRLAFSKEEKNAREYLKSILHAMGCKISEDSIGNMFAILEGKNPTLPPIITGSHVDSVPNGGCYDGVLGVVCSLEAIRAIQNSGQSFMRSIGLVVFSCEESSRFNMATLGSKLISGKLSIEKLHELKDKEGISVYEAAKNFGCTLHEEDLKVQNNSFYGYIELHIEQGPVLEQKNISMGVVLAIAAPIRYKLKLIGNADHSGATPMDMRKDALVCASEIIIEIERLALKEKTTVATVGYVNAIPGVLNVIPGAVELGIDIRDIDKEALVKTDKAINKAIRQIANKRDISFELQLLSRDFPTLMDDKIINILAEESKKAHIDYMKLPSGAGHDAMNMKGIATHTGMIFVPCKGGVSHNVNEAINIKDAYKATFVLAHAIVRLANEE